MHILKVTLGEFITFAGYALPAVLLWYFFFRYKNKNALPREVVRDTFFIGMFSVIPLLSYQYIYTKLIPSLSTTYLSTIFSSKGILLSILQIMGAFIMLGLFFIVITGCFTIIYSLFTKESLFNTLKALISEPLNFSATGVIFIVILIFDLFLQVFTPFKIPTQVISTTFLLATLEEYSKHLVVRLFDDHKIKNIANAIELSIIVALSFAFLENIIYFAGTNAGSVQSVIIGRSVISMFGHVIFSAIFGYYYGVAKFAEPYMLTTSAETHEPKLPKWFHKVFHLKTNVSFKSQKIFEGLLFASITHAVFNTLLQYGAIVLVIPILFAGGFLIDTMLRSEIAQRDFSLVGTKTMPKEDFEKLIWKISVLKHIKNIKKTRT
jgi:RsiW-degrading membrane proteinase PrsW (M82 family)